MGHAAGVCHLYLHAGADPGDGRQAGRRRQDHLPGGLQRDRDAAVGRAARARRWTPCAEALKQAGVELRADEATRKRVPWAKPATDADFGFEFGANVIAVKQVGGIDDAMAHIAAHGSKHTEAIVTGDAAAARTLPGRGRRRRRSSTTRAPASPTATATAWAPRSGSAPTSCTRAGPVGVEGLLTYRWLLRGSGQETASYGPGKRPFKHRDSSEAPGRWKRFFLRRATRRERAAPVPELHGRVSTSTGGGVPRAGRSAHTARNLR